MPEYIDEPARGVWTHAPDEQLSYTMWSVFKVADRAALDAAAGGPPDTAANPTGRGDVADEVAGLLDQAARWRASTRMCSPTRWPASSPAAASQRALVAGLS